ncbi:MAG: hypothetical protein VXW65_11915 [Pseudomonadota bacterium]|nr:hypothetical protein [Pseudomonadota bacterium]
MSIVFSPAVVSDRLQALTRALDADSDAGQLLIYSGAQPSAGDVPAGDLLIALSFSKPSMSGISGGVLTLSNPAPEFVAISGIATWGRLTDGAGAWVADVSVGAQGSGAVFEINQPTTQLYAGAELTVTVATLTEA